MKFNITLINGKNLKNNPITAFEIKEPEIIFKLNRDLNVNLPINTYTGCNLIKSDNSVSQLINPDKIMLSTDDNGKTRIKIRCININTGSRSLYEGIYEPI